MAEIVRSGESNSLVVPLGITGMADAASWWVENEVGAVVRAAAPVAGAGFNEGSVSVTVEGAINTLAAGAHSGFFLVRVRFSADAEFEGEREVELGYRVVASQELVIQVNSFVTYNEALSIASSLADVATFNAASRAQRVAHLADAWHSLVALRYSISFDDSQSRITDFPGLSTGLLQDYSAAEFAALDKDFLIALKRAQVIEANERMAGPADYRAKGIISTRIGETAQTFRMSKPLDMAISPRAMRALRGYLALAGRIGRA